MSPPLVLRARRSRKYRTDPLVHFVIVMGANGERNHNITCTNYWVFKRQVVYTDDAVTCINCAANIDRRLDKWR